MPSGRLNVISFRDRVEKARTVALELHRTDSTHVLQCGERSRSPECELGEGTIREYNIWRHVFLAGDAGADGLERGEQPFVRRTNRYFRIVLADPGWVTLLTTRSGASARAALLGLQGG